MKSILYLTLLSLITAQTKQKYQFPPTRIVGGYEVNPSFKYPWMVSLYFKGKHYCGGALINGNTVISAAHCVHDPDSDWKALVHRHNLTLSAEKENGKTYNIVKRIKHPYYNANTKAYDISIWKIDAPKGFTGVKVDDGKYSNADNTLLKVIGWGRIESGGALSSTLLEVKVPVYNADKCQERVYPFMDTYSQFCAGYAEGGKDACQGDSGGPLFIEENGSPVLVGVVSWGKSCALKGYPGVYTRISANEGFINQYLNDTGKRI